MSSITKIQSQPFLIPPNTSESSFNSIRKIFINVSNLNKRNDLIIKIKSIPEYFVLLDQINSNDDHSVEITEIETLKNKSSKEIDSSNLIIVGEHWSDSEMINAFTMGAKGFITISSSNLQLKQIIGLTLTYNGNYLLHQISQRMKASKLLNHLSKSSTYFTKDNSLECPLSDKEISILLKISNGDSSKSIAEDLNLGEQTIKNYVADILLKSGAKNRANAVYISLKNNWINNSI